MIDLNNPKLSFMLITSNKIDAMMSAIWSKDYQFLPIKEYYNGQNNE